MGNPLGQLLLLPCLVIKVNGQPQQPNAVKMTNGTDPSEMKLWIILSGEEPESAKELYKGKRNIQ
jgi:hypothetical protein